MEFFQAASRQDPLKDSLTAEDSYNAIRTKMLAELKEYEDEILYPLATQQIEIDLDDGVLVNYNKFGSALKKVSGLSEN